MSETKTAKRLTGGIIAIIVLAVCLCITTFALVYASVSVENNLFHTGGVKINLNDGKPVIREHEFLFEPGMTVVKDFFIENDSTWEVYYRLYLDNVSGGLSRVLTVTIKDGDKILYTGTANELTKQNVIAADDTLQNRAAPQSDGCVPLPRKQRQRNAEPRPHLYAVRRGNANEKQPE